jgi:TRAP-type C4-dicarboxylate transport system permease small subunit
MQRSLVDKLFAGLETIMAALLACMVVLVFGNVVLRYGFDTGILMSEELSRFAMVWMVFVGAIVAARDGAHLGTDALVARLRRPGRRICAAFSQLLTLACCATLVYGLWQQHSLYAETRAPVTQVPMIWVYGIGYVTAIGIGASSLYRLLRVATNRATERELGIVEQAAP